MRQKRMYFLFAILIVIALAVVFLLNSCVTVPTDTYGNTIIVNPTDIPVPFGKEMTLIGQHEDVQVFKVIDNITEVTCYVTINSQRYQPSSIFCIK